MQHRKKIITRERSPRRLRNLRPLFFGPFITRIIGTDGLGNDCVVTSRRHRKHLQPLRLKDLERQANESLPGKIWLRVWAPHQASWWIAVLFMIGSALFGLGAALAIFPSLLTPEWHIPTASNSVFFVGSIFFTTAAATQFLEVINADISSLPEGPATTPVDEPRWRWFAWRPRNLGYLACAVQLIGTVLFNFNTGDAFLRGTSATAKDLTIWTPNMVGSVFFLVASAFAYLEVAHRIGYFKLDDITIWIALMNGLGSIAFQVSAIASFYEPGGSLSWVQGSNWGTFLGGIGFLIASYLCIPELFEEEGEIAQRRQSAEATAPGAAGNAPSTT